MTLLDEWTFIQAIANTRNIELTIEQFNVYLEQAHYELMDERVKGFEVNNHYKISLAPFISNGLLNGTIVNGVYVVNLPSSVRKVLNVYMNGVEVDEVTHKEYGDRLNDELTKPSPEHPVYYLSGSSLHINAGGSASSVTYSYISYGDVPMLVLKSENGIAAYDSANSTEPQWKKHDRRHLAKIVLGFMGISVGDDFLLSVTENQVKDDN